MIKVDAIYNSLAKIEKQNQVYELTDDSEMKMKTLENMIKEFDLIGDVALEGIKDATDLLKKIGSEDLGKRIDDLKKLSQFSSAFINLTVQKGHSCRSVYLEDELESHLFV